MLRETTSLFVIFLCACGGGAPGSDSDSDAGVAEDAAADVVVVSDARSDSAIPTLDAGIDGAAPPEGSNVGSPPSFAGYRDGTNTGYQGVYDSNLGRKLQLSDLKTYTGSTTFSTAGAVIYRQHITGPITITADTTFEQCLIDAPAPTYVSGVIVASKKNGYLIKMVKPAPIGTFIDCEIDGKGTSGGSTGPFPTGDGYESIFDPGFNANVLRANCHGTIDIMKPGGGSYFGYSWLHGNAHFYDSSGADTHSDHVQIATGGLSGTTIEYCTMGTSKLAADAAAADWTQYEPLINGGLVQIGSGFNANVTLSNLTFQYNYAQDGNYALNGGPAECASVSNVTVRGNRFGLHERYGAMSSLFVQSALDNSKFTFTGDNVYDVSGTGFWGSAVTAGQVVQ